MGELSPELTSETTFGAFVHNDKRLLLLSGHKAGSSRTVRAMPKSQRNSVLTFKTIVTEANFLRLQNFEQKASDTWSRPIAGDTRLAFVLAPALSCSRNSPKSGCGLGSAA